MYTEFRCLLRSSCPQESRMSEHLPSCCRSTTNWMWPRPRSPTSQQTGNFSLQPVGDIFQKRGPFTSPLLNLLLCNSKRDMFSTGPLSINTAHMSINIGYFAINTGKLYQHWSFVFQHWTVNTYLLTLLTCLSTLVISLLKLVTCLLTLVTWYSTLVSYLST